MLPPRTVLAAVDFSDASRLALDFASRLVRHCQGVLHVLHAQDPSLEAVALERQQDLAADTVQELRAFAATVHPPLDAWVPHVVFGPPTDVICNIADRERADLIVLGAVGLTGGERTILGSTAEAVLRCANVSVLVVPATWTAPQAESPDLSGVGPIVAGTELSGPSLGAAVAAARLAGALGAPLELVHVVETPSVLPRWNTLVQSPASRVATARADLATALGGVGMTADTVLHVRTGPVAETLVQSAAPGGGRQPLLVMGRRIAPTRAAAPASTAARVLQRSAAPVLLHLPDPES